LVLPALIVVSKCDLVFATLWGHVHIAISNVIQAHFYHAFLNVQVVRVVASCGSMVGGDSLVDVFGVRVWKPNVIFVLSNVLTSHSSKIVHVLHKLIAEVVGRLNLLAHWVMYHVRALDHFLTSLSIDRLLKLGTGVSHVILVIDIGRLLLFKEVHYIHFF